MHVDIFGKELLVGHTVLFCFHNNLTVGVITKVHAKMVTVSAVNFTRTTLKYPSDTARVDGSEVSMYMLKYSGTR